MASKIPSRSSRWYAAAQAAVHALEELKAVQEEYGEWRGNLPENLQASALGEKLETICDIDIDGALEAAQEALDVEVPLGFRRD